MTQITTSKMLVSIHSNSFHIPYLKRQGLSKRVWIASGFFCHWSWFVIIKNGKKNNLFLSCTAMSFKKYIQIFVVKSCSSRLKTANKRFSGSFNGGWVSQYGGADQFLQIDLSNVTKVTRIATQGRYDAGWWTKTYTLSYSNDGAAFTAYKNGEVTLEYSDPRPYNII